MRTHIAAFIAALLILAAPATAVAGISSSTAQSMMNKQVHDDAGEGWTWVDCGSIHPLVTHTSNGYVARGDFIYRGRPGFCGLNTQVCSWTGQLADNGMWLDHRKYNCR